MTGAPHITHYDWRGQREPMLRFGPVDGPIVIAALPLLEEANRTRAFTVAILRALAAHGIGSALPDLPGTGESLTPLSTLRLADLRDAFTTALSQAAAERSFGLAIRSGALLGTHASLAGWWCLAPQNGPDLVRELSRVRRGAKQRGDTWRDDGTPVTIAGNVLAAELLSDLAQDRATITGPYRTVRLDGDPAPSERSFPGNPLWRRSEPESDPAIATALANDIADWIATCGG